MAAPGTSLTVPLTGTVLAPNMIFSPNPVAVGTLLRTPITQAITVTNVGPGIGVINAVT